MSTTRNPLLLLTYATIVTLWTASLFVLVPYVVHLLVLVTALLIAACHQSLLLLPPPEGSSTHSVSSTERETLRQEDAYQFPIIGSVSLFGLYLAFRFLDKDLVNLLIGLYFGVVGIIAVTMTLAPCTQVLIATSWNKPFQFQPKLSHPFPSWLAGPSPWQQHWAGNMHDILALLVAIAVTATYMVASKPWYLNNILGMAFCMQGIAKFSLGTYKIGAILLIGLFLYDIFWVFGTDVMVTVAKNLDGPIKLLFPRSDRRNPDTGKLDTSLLGLGDIVIPGFFLALLLRFDAHRAKVQNLVHAKFPKPYFWTSLVAYVVGLATTLYVMIAFSAAQPALLYLVPALLISSSLCAVVRGEWKELLEYSEEEEEEENTQTDKKKD